MPSALSSACIIWEHICTANFMDQDQTAPFASISKRKINSHYDQRRQLDGRITCNCNIANGANIRGKDAADLLSIQLQFKTASQIDKIKILMTNGSLMKVESIPIEAFCNTFDLH